MKPKQSIEGYEMREVDGVGWLSRRRARTKEKLVYSTFFIGLGITAFELALTTVMQASTVALLAGALLMCVSAIAATQL
jgi:hypothetical protein